MGSFIMLNNPVESDSKTTVPDNSPSPERSPSGNTLFTPPSLSLPKGGGAIAVWGQKFAANPVTGTGSTRAACHQPRSLWLQHQLSLSYDSGAGNGPFGFGWSLSLPSVARKTDKGLPQYLDKAAISQIVMCLFCQALKICAGSDEKPSRRLGNPGF